MDKPKSIGDWIGVGVLVVFAACVIVLMVSGTIWACRALLD